MTVGGLEAGPLQLTARLGPAIERLLPTYRELLRDLVREPSTLGNERAAQLAVSRALRRQGLEPTLYDLDLGLLGRHAAFAPTGLSYTERPNLSATWPATGNGRSLVLNGHIDVVSAEPESWWTHAPFSGTVDRGRLYGRGAYDMKGGLVAAMLALHAVRDALPPLQGAVHVESVIEEECTGNGTLAARLRGPTVDAALIAEPTDLHVWLATLGVIWFELTVVGRPAYVGQAGAYVNAIEKACDVVVALRAIPEELNRAFSHPLFPSGAKPLTLNIGRIHGGDWASNVPLECTITGRMSFPIDWPVERAQRLLEERVAQHAASDPWPADHPPAIHYPGFRAAGWQADPDQPLLQLLDQVVRAVVGEPLTRTVFAGTADARYFGPSGRVVFFGPAGGNQHAPDEYLDLDSFVAAARIIALLMAEWCSQERQ